MNILVTISKRQLRTFQEITKYKNTPIPVNGQFYEISCSQDIFAIVGKQQFLLFILASEKGGVGGVCVTKVQKSVMQKNHSYICNDTIKIQRRLSPKL